MFSPITSGTYGTSPRRSPNPLRLVVENKQTTEVRLWRKRVDGTLRVTCEMSPDGALEMLVGLRGGVMLHTITAFFYRLPTGIPAFTDSDMYAIFSYVYHHVRTFTRIYAIFTYIYLYLRIYLPSKTTQLCR